MRDSVCSAFDKVEKSVRAFFAGLASNGEFRDEDGVIVAFSGGGDSLGMLIGIAAVLGCENIVAAYVDHGIRSRDELDTELRLNAENCRKLGVRFCVCTLVNGAVTQMSRQRRCGTEEAARVLRYEALESKRRELDLGWIATAHNAEDQAETVLMRLLGGKALSSLKGIRRRIGRIIRPVLDISGSLLREVCVERGLVWSDDSTNSEDSYLRNKIRHILVPEIEKLFPRYDEALLRFSCEMEELDSGCVLGNPSDGVSLNLLQSLPQIQRKALLLELWDLSLNDDFVCLSRGMMDRILRAVEQGRSCNLAGSGVWVSILSGRITIHRDVKAGPWKHELDLSRSGERIDLPGGHALVRGDCCQRNDKSVNLSDGKEIYLFSEFLQGRVCVRQVMDGDVINLAGGRKNVLDLMQEMGIPRPKRGLVPLVCDEREVVAVMGRAFGGSDRICRKCRCTLAPNDLSLYIVE